MAAAGEQTPARRKEPEDRVADVGTPVQVQKTCHDDDGKEMGDETVLGIVRAREEFDIDDAPARVTVETKEREINTSAERVEVAVGTHADLVKDLIGGRDV